jgi:aldehyde:ferredoxin oxidoreductase
MRRDIRLFSYAGKILRVNLSNGGVRFEPTAKYAKDWLGSSGIAIKILYDELRPWVTPFDPANKIILSAGVLQGTPAPGACKSNISTLGPMTGGWASSCSDSHTGGELKYSGYDSIVIEGKTRNPVYLLIQDEKVEIRNAGGLWGKTTWETLEFLRRELQDPNLHVISIGPAGENLVRGACVVQDRNRAFGRCGVGAVMGSKNLKAIVVRGKGSVEVADPKRFMESVRKIRKMVQGAKSLKKMQTYGTLGSLSGKQLICGTSWKNFQEVYVPDAIAEIIEPCKMIDKYRAGRICFPGCVVGCGNRLNITEGPYAGLKTDCNQWEAFGTLQCRLAITEPTFMVKANSLCNQMGLDVDAAGGAVGWAMECFERGIINEKDTDGLKLEWGDADVALTLIKKIAHREGFGNILAEGCSKAADLIGRESQYFAIHIKGQDLYEPGRAALGWLLGTTTSTRGGGHTTGVIIDARPGIDKEDLQKAKSIFQVDNPVNHLDYEGRAKMVMYMESMHRSANCLGVCHFNTIHWDFQMIDLPHLAELYSAATGWETSAEDLKYLTMRQLNLEKAFNLRHTNFDRKDDMPARREIEEPIPTGPLAGWKMDMKKYDQMLDEYYELHGWDANTSYPKRKVLEELGLGYVANDLERIGKLR